MTALTGGGALLDGLGAGGSERQGKCRSRTLAAWVTSGRAMKDSMSTRRRSVTRSIATGRGPAPARLQRRRGQTAFRPWTSHAAAGDCTAHRSSGA